MRTAVGRSIGVRRLSYPLLLCALGLGLGASALFYPAGIAFVLPAVGTVLLLLALCRFCGKSNPSGTTRIVDWCIGSFVLHLALGLIIWNVGSLRDYLGPDAGGYHVDAIQLAQHWLVHAPSPMLPTGKEGFYFLLAALYWAFGPHAEAGLIIDAGLMAAVVPVMVDATYRQFGGKAARCAPVIVTLLPGFVIWGSQLLREAGVYLLIAVALNCTIRLVRRPTLAASVTLALAAALMATFRADVALIVTAGLMIGLVVGRRAGSAGLMATTGTAVIVGLLILGAGIGYSGFHLVTHSSLQDISTVRTGSSQGVSSGFLPSADVGTTGGAVAYLPLGVTYFSLGPLPWQIHGARQLPALPDALAWWFLLPSLWTGIAVARRRVGREVLLALIPALLLTVALSLLIANFGTTVRERMQVILLLVPLISVGWSERRERYTAPTSVYQQPVALVAIQDSDITPDSQLPAPAPTQPQR